MTEAESGSSQKSPQDWRLSGTRIELFKQRLTDAIRFFYHPLGANQDIRSELDNPNSRMMEGYESISLEAKIALVDTVFEMRRRILAVTDPQFDKELNFFLADKLPLAGGRLGFYDPECNLTDGAADVASEGFFDYNEPGWSTWVDYILEDRPDHFGRKNSHLVFWVPAEYLDKADHGIEANPEQCIGWLDQHSVYWDMQTPYLDQVYDLVKQG